MTDTTEIIVNAYTNMLEIHGLDEEVATRLFGRSSDEFEADGRGGMRRVTRRTLGLSWDAHFSIAKVPYCRWNECFEALRGVTDSVRLNHCARACPMPVHDWTGGFEQWVTQFAQTIEENPVGRILIEENRQWKYSISLICELFSECNVLVVVPNNEVGREVVQVVNEVEPHRATLSLSELDGCTQLVQVCCAGTAGAINPEYFQVVIYVDLIKSLGADSLRNALTLHEHRIYAIEDTRKPLERDQSSKAECLAGLPIFDFRTVIRQPIHFQLVNVPFGSHRDPTNTLEFKRSQIWLNDDRNRAIAAMANALVTGGEPINLAIPDDVRPPFTAAILVESPAHARALHDFLPDWFTLFRGQSPFDTRTMSAPHKCIITRAWASAQDRMNVQVLIRAEGEQSPLALSAFDPRMRPLSTPRLLIDFVDENMADQASAIAQIYQAAGFSTFNARHQPSGTMP